MHQFVTPPDRREPSRSNQQLQQAVTQLGLKFDLATRWTSFVAVSKKIYNTNPSSGVDANVAVPKVAGVSNLAYTAPAMTGYGAPEPGLLASLLVAMMGLGAIYKRRRSKLSL
jgi:Ca-activated chloride channel family protein